MELAIAIGLKPQVLLLDEPAAGVPSTESHIILDAIERLPEHIAVLIIEHDMDVVFRFAKRVTVMVGVGVRNGVSDSVTVGDGVSVSVGLGVVVTVAVGVSVGVGVVVTLAVGVSVGVGVGVTVRVAVGVGVATKLGSKRPIFMTASARFVNQNLPSGPVTML